MRTGQSERRWSWPRDVVLPLGHVAMESLWLYAAVRVAMAFAPPPFALTFAHLFALAAGTALLGRLSLRLPRAHPWSRLLLLPGSAVLIGVWLHLLLAPAASWSLASIATVVLSPGSLRPDVSGAFVVMAWTLALYLTGRGLLIGVQSPSVTSVSRWFVGGAAVLVALFMVLAWTAVPADQLPGAELRRLVLGYFIVGLLLTAFAHRHTIYRHAGVQPAAWLPWAAAIVLPVALVILAGTMILEGTASTLQVMLRDALALLIAGAWYVLSWCGYGLLALFRWLARMFPTEAGDMDAPLAPAATPRLPVFDPRQIDLEPSNAAFPFIAVAILLMVLALFIRALFKARAGRETVDMVEESTSIWSWALLWLQLLGLWRGMRARWQAHRTRWTEGPIRRLDEADDACGLGDIRQIYRTLLRWAAARGAFRAPPQTPHEFARQLARIAPASADYVEPITGYYVQARYGTTVLSDTDVQRAREAARMLLARDSSTEQT